jgi:S-adenosylmethionine hydrolase
MGVVTFLSDYGVGDEFVGVCHGVIARLAPDVRVIDLTHGVERHDVRAGALMLRDALPFMPPGVHLAVVDPEVGGTRRAIALRCVAEERFLVGPDNGLLTLAAERFGGVDEVVDIGHSPWRLEPVSATFHGRDLFAPIAARLALGEPLGEAGEPLDAADLVPLELPTARVEAGDLVAHAVAADRFGNVTLDATRGQLAEAGVRLGDEVDVVAYHGARRGRYARTFIEVAAKQLVVYEDARGNLALAINRGSAEAELRLGRDDELRLRRPT